MKTSELKKLLILTLLALASLPLGGAIGADDPVLPGLEPPTVESRNAILKSPEWRKAMRGLDAWLSRQALYNKEQVNKYKVNLTKKINKMSADELSDFLQDTQRKLAVLNGPDARAARGWLREELAVASDSYGAEIKKRIPNPESMSADQIEDYLKNFERRQAQTQTMYKELASQRERQAATIQATRQQRHDDYQKALDRASSDAVNYGGYNGGPIGYQGHNYIPGDTRGYFGGYYGW